MEIKRIRQKEVKVYYMCPDGFSYQLGLTNAESRISVNGSFVGYADLAHAEFHKKRGGFTKCDGSLKKSYGPHAFVT